MRSFAPLLITCVLISMLHVSDAADASTCKATMVYSTCSKTCGGGTQTGRYECQDANGASCSGCITPFVIVTRDCNTDPCSGSTTGTTAPACAVCRIDCIQGTHCECGKCVADTPTPAPTTAAPSDCSKYPCVEVLCMQGYHRVSTPNGNCCPTITCVKDTPTPAPTTAAPDCTGVHCVKPLCIIGYKLVTKAGDCCQTCVPDTNPTTTAPSCAAVQCVKPMCIQGDKLVTKPGHCCPTCVPNKHSTAAAVSTLAPATTTSLDCSKANCIQPMCVIGATRTILPGTCCPVCIPAATPAPTTCPVCTKMCIKGFHCNCGQCVPDVTTLTPAPSCPACNKMCIKGTTCVCNQCVPTPDTTAPTKGGKGKHHKGGK
jgi:hypothetical protein